MILHAFFANISQLRINTLLASATIDYDYIMELVAKSDQSAPGKQKMTREHALMADVVPLLKQRALGRDTSGLSGYGS